MLLECLVDQSLLLLLVVLALQEHLALPSEYVLYLLSSLQLLRTVYLLLQHTPCHPLVYLSHGLKVHYLIYSTSDLFSYKGTEEVVATVQ